MAVIESLTPDACADDAPPVCPRNYAGEFVGPRCEPYTGCYYEVNHGERGCGCCFVHCICQPEERLVLG